MMGHFLIEFSWDSNVQMAGEPVPTDIRKQSLTFNTQMLITGISVTDKFLEI